MTKTMTAIESVIWLIIADEEVKKIEKFIEIEEARKNEIRAKELKDIVRDILTKAIYIKKSLED